MFFQKGIWTQEITYDSSYNPVAITLYNPEDIIEEQYTYKYEYDQFHNWIRKEEYYNDLLMNFWKDVGLRILTTDSLSDFISLMTSLSFPKPNKSIINMF